MWTWLGQPVEWYVKEVKDNFNTVVLENRHRNTMRMPKLKVKNDCLFRGRMVAGYYPNEDKFVAVRPTLNGFIPAVWRRYYVSAKKSNSEFEITDSSSGEKKWVTRDDLMRAYQQGTEIAGIQNNAIYICRMISTGYERVSLEDNMRYVTSLGLKVSNEVIPK